MYNADLSLLQNLDCRWTVHHMGKQHPSDSFEQAMSIGEDLIRTRRKHAIHELSGKCHAFLRTTPLHLFGTSAIIQVDLALTDKQLYTNVQIL